MKTSIRISICLLVVGLASCNKDKKGEIPFNQRERTNTSFLKETTKPVTVPADKQLPISSVAPTQIPEKTFPVVSFRDCQAICQRISECGVKSFTNTEDCQEGCERIIDILITKKDYECLGKATTCSAVKQCIPKGKNRSLSQLDLASTTIIFEHYGVQDTPIDTLFLLPSMNPISNYKGIGIEGWKISVPLSLQARVKWIQEIINRKEYFHSESLSDKKGTFKIYFIDKTGPVVLTFRREKSIILALRLKEIAQEEFAANLEAIKQMERLLSWFAHPLPNNSKLSPSSMNSAPLTMDDPQELIRQAKEIVILIKHVGVQDEYMQSVILVPNNNYKISMKKKYPEDKIKPMSELARRKFLQYLIDRKEFSTPSGPRGEYGDCRLEFISSSKTWKIYRKRNQIIPMLQALAETFTEDEQQAKEAILYLKASLE